MTTHVQFLVTQNQTIRFESEKLPTQITPPIALQTESQTEMAGKEGRATCAQKVAKRCRAIKAQKALSAFLASLPFHLRGLHIPLEDNSVFATSLKPPSVLLHFIMYTQRESSFHSNIHMVQ